MIETDIRTIKQRQKVSRTKTSQEIKTLARRQTIHEKANNKQFQAIASAITLLPTQDVITKTIQDTIKVTVNGKIDKIDSKVDMVGEHLKQQDAAIETINKKIKPVDSITNWAKETYKGLIIIGTITGVIYGVIKLFHIKI